MERIYRPGGFWRRWIAFTIDMQVISIIAFPINIMASLFLTFFVSRARSTVFALGLTYLIQFVVLLAAYVTYCRVFFRRRGATPGKLVMGLKVVQNGNGLNLSWGGIIRREFIGRFFSTIFLFAGYLLAPLRSDRRALHDLIGGSRVLYRVQ